ncbi:hypothetical protein DAPPUDRAFT_96544 [Daphnia pulex]|uniref:Uncharacterized protein n=1 Tax=Daphnia pulex TaxID=6669 RepID=E9FY59_DAPPU|nr:hypothetical protein DAPPUDRAFT_96544 [Daphnia pulex]|eukprot:EFX87833.1 hypothetical protein DAPPUDRAFT_96544 [Daphnia pulex]
MTNPITWTTTSSTIPMTSSSNFSPWTSLPITHRTKVPLEHRQKNNSTIADDFGEHSTNQSNFDNKIIWISLGATAIICTLTVFVILCQRDKIAKFLRKSENPDVLDDAFYYTDVSMGRRENQPNSVTYENVIPNLLLNEPNYIELDFNVQKNSNPENAAAEINSTTLNQKRDIKGYVDSVIYAELRK